MPQMTEFEVKDIKIVITESHRFRKLEENINVQRRNMEHKKDGPKQTSRNKNYNV